MRSPLSRFLQPIPTPCTNQALTSHLPCIHHTMSRYHMHTTSKENLSEHNSNLACQALFPWRRRKTLSKQFHNTIKYFTRSNETEFCDLLLRHLQWKRAQLPTLSSQGESEKETENTWQYVTGTQGSDLRFRVKNKILLSSRVRWLAEAGELMRSA
jgi:hypothetical protein